MIHFSDNNTLVAKVIIYLRSREHQAAEHFLLFGLKQNPRNYTACNLLGLTQCYQKKYEQAKESFRHNIKQNNREAYLCLAVLLLDLNNYDDAFYLTNSCNKEQPSLKLKKLPPEKLAKTYLEQGYLFYEAGEYNEAITKFQEALSISPLDEEIKIGLARSYIQTNQPQKAKETLENNLSSQILNSMTYTVLGLACYKLKQIPLTKQYWNLAITLNPKCKSTQMYLHSADIYKKFNEEHNTIQLS
jgi:tetratricopeptide (TPR) repeat protein